MEIFDCAGCDELVTQIPVFDAAELWWVGPDKARKFCTDQCLDAFQERHAMRGAA